MLKLCSLAEVDASNWPRGHWYELAPGPDDGKHWAPDGTFVRMDEWERMLEPLIEGRVPDYDRYRRTHADASAWEPFLDYLAEVAQRLREADEAPMLHVLLPELPVALRWELARGFPTLPAELAADLDAVSDWVTAALRHWKSITIIGL
ncbi:hypothetical protein [Roseateles sp. BYS87W]|uniref:Uncharacterized protein n=1 Tax=Pelomonas baiyunensis TaxID=3299026 RepID=A0ABW7H0G9_9BURK